MRTFHKQIIPMLLFWGGLSVAAAVLIFQGVHTIIEDLAAENTKFLMERLQPIVDDALKQVNYDHSLTVSQKQELRAIILADSLASRNLQELFVADSSRVLFSLNNTAGFTLEERALSMVPGDFVLSRPGDAVRGLWRSGGFDVLIAIEVDPRSGFLRPILQEMMVKLYLTAFAGLIGIVFLAMLGSRMARSPINRVQKVLAAIENRKYGFRLKWKSDDEFADLYQKANEALRRMEQLDSAQRTAVRQRNVTMNESKTTSRYLDIMSHEIKNPLHALGINLDVLRSKIEKKPSPQSALKHLDIIEREVEHLQEVVLGFLSYVRPGVPKKIRADLNRLVTETSQAVSAEAKKANVRLETRFGKGLRKPLIDPRQIKQALHNLTINAIHATGEQGKITIRTWAKRNRLFVQVKDSGNGISKEDLKKIFDLYYTTKERGSGLGLPVSRRLIEANDGDLKLESSVGKGTTATISFSV